MLSKFEFELANRVIVINIQDSVQVKNLPAFRLMALEKEIVHLYKFSPGYLVYPARIMMIRDLSGKTAIKYAPNSSKGVSIRRIVMQTLLAIHILNSIFIRMGGKMVSLIHYVLY